MNFWYSVIFLIVSGAVDVPNEAVATLIESHGFSTEAPEGTAQPVAENKVTVDDAEVAAEADTPTTGDVISETPAKKTK